MGMLVIRIVRIRVEARVLYGRKALQRPEGLIGVGENDQFRVNLEIFREMSFKGA